jgi:ApeA N-terminal domain 1
VRIQPFDLVAFQPRILGETRKGRPITLEHCNGRSVSLAVPGFGVSSYGAQIVLDGAWYQPDEEVAFDAIAVRFSDLDPWACVSGFSYRINRDEEGETLTSLEMSFTPPDDIEVALEDGTTLRVEFPWTWTGPGQPVTTEFGITQAAEIHLVFKEPADIERSLTYVAQLRNFLSLAIGRPIRILSVRGFHNPPPDAERDPFTKLVPRLIEVELLYRMVGLPEPAERPLHPAEMLFTLADTHRRLEDILRAWFSKQALLGPVLTRYFHLVHTPPTSREHELESLVRVLETHHRRTHGPAEKTPEHEERLASILDSTPEEQREWLAKKLRHSHEPTLAERLRASLDRCPTITSRLIGDSERAKDSFIWKVTATRHFETHLDPSGEAAAASGVDVVTLTFQLRALVEMTLLLEIGFSCDEIASIFERESSRYSRVDHLRSLA